MKDTGEQKEKHQTEERGIGDSVNRPAIVREIPHFGLFHAFLRERPVIQALFQNNKNRLKIAIIIGFCMGKFCSKKFCKMSMIASPSY